MVYANEFLIEGLVATGSGMLGELQTATTRPDLIREIVLTYGERQTKGNLVTLFGRCSAFLQRQIVLSQREWMF
jgi:hypothetical protein